MHLPLLPARQNHNPSRYAGTNSKDNLRDNAIDSVVGVDKNNHQRRAWVPTWKQDSAG